MERGTHQSLYELGGRYFDLYTKQHGIEQNLFLAPDEGDVPEEIGANGSVAGDTDAADVLDRETVRSSISPMRPIASEISCPPHFSFPFVFQCHHLER